MVSTEGLGQNVAALLTLEGAGFVKHPDGSQTQLWQGIKLEIGDIIVTSPGTRAVIVLSDGSEFEFGKDQGDAVKIDTSVLDYVADVNEVKVLDLSYLYPLLNEHQLDRVNVPVDESAQAILVADGSDSDGIKDLLDGNEANNPAASGDLNGGDLLSGNRYVVLESRELPHDSNPFATNHFATHSGLANHLEAHQDSLPIERLSQELHVSLSVTPAFDDELPVFYHVTIDQTLTSDLVLHLTLIDVDENNAGYKLPDFIIPKGSPAGQYDLPGFSLPAEETNNNLHHYTLVLTHATGSLDGMAIASSLDGSPVPGEHVVASNSTLSIASDYLSENTESAVSINWLPGDALPTLDDEADYTGCVSVKITDPSFLSVNFADTPTHFDVWAVSGDIYIKVATLTTGHDASVGVIEATSHDSSSLSFDNIPFDMVKIFGEGNEDLVFTLQVTPADLPYPGYPVDLGSILSGQLDWTHANVELPPIVDPYPEAVTFTLSLDPTSIDQVNGAPNILDPEIDQTHFSVHFSSPLIPADFYTGLQLEVFVGTDSFGILSFNPNNVQGAEGFSPYDPVYNPEDGSYSFALSLPETEDGQPHQVSLSLVEGQDLTMFGFESINLDGSTASVDYIIPPDVEVTIDADLTVNDDDSAITIVHLSHALSQDLVLNVNVDLLDADGNVVRSIHQAPVTIDAGEVSNEILIPSIEDAEGFTIAVSVSYDPAMNESPLVYFDVNDPANAGLNLTHDPITVDISQATNTFAVAADTLEEVANIVLTPVSSTINDEVSTMVTFNYVVDHAVNAPTDFILMIDGSHPTGLGNITIDSTTGSFSIPTSYFVDGLHTVTLQAVYPALAAEALGVESVVVDSSQSINVVDYSIVQTPLIGGATISTFVFSEHHDNSPDINAGGGGDPLHPVDLIQGFDPNFADAIRFEHAVIGDVHDFTAAAPSAESNSISHVDVVDGLVTFMRADNHIITINEGNLNQAIEFLINHSAESQLGSTVEFNVTNTNNNTVDTIVFNHGADNSYTIANVAGVEAQGLALNSYVQQWITIESGH